METNIEAVDFADNTQKMEMDESQSRTAYRHYAQDAISDSSADFSSKGAHKRPWSDESHDNSEEQDTLMSGDDSLSSCCSILEVRPMKRLRIQDNQSQHTTLDKGETQYFINKPQYVIRPLISDDASISTPTMMAECLTSHPSMNIPPLSSLNELSSAKDVSLGPNQGRINVGAVTITEGSESAGCDPRNTTKIHESNGYTGFNSFLGDLHIQRRNRLAADGAIRQNNNSRSIINSSRSLHPEGIRDELNLQKGQTQCHQRQIKTKPTWKRQIRLQSHSQLH